MTLEERTFGTPCSVRYTAQTGENRTEKSLTPVIISLTQFINGLIYGTNTIELKAIVL